MNIPRVPLFNNKNTQQFPDFKRTWWYQTQGGTVAVGGERRFLQEFVPVFFLARKSIF
jgi:hypothetical protein